MPQSDCLIMQVPSQMFLLGEQISHEFQVINF